MANLAHKMPTKALCVYSICSLILIIPVIKADPSIQFFGCRNTSNTDGNLNTASNSTVSMCVGDISNEKCKECLDYASRYAVEHCPEAKQVKIIYDSCTLSYSNDSTPTIKGPDPNFLYVECPNATLSTTSTYAPNSTYQTNLQNLLSVLSANSNNASNGFYNFTAGSSPPDVAYGLFICRGDISASVCRDCVSYAVKDVVERCPRSKRVTIWYDECIVRYSNVSIFSVEDTSFRLTLRNPQNVTNATSFREALGKVMDDVSTRASSHVSGRKFATGELNYSPLLPVYGLAQCMPDLSTSDCYSCLRTGISIFPSCCDANLGARVLFPSCYVHYETYPIVGNSTVSAVPPPPPPSPALPPLPGSTTTSSQEKGIIIAIVVPIGVSVMLWVVGFCFVTRRAKKKYNTTKEANELICQGGDDISTMQSLQYDFNTIQAATNNFSNDNKIGEGGFGHIYKGLLPDEQEVAVKRLSQSSGQGGLEYKNEVLLVAKLQHINIVRLLGFCLDGEEKILIYEFVTNKSLDYFIFDQQEQILDWSGRYKIIGGIARGLLYLHEDSQLRIIHRDLKASNILLDGDMNAKISDFGMAQILGVDQTRGNASEIIGTFGYMSPEYAMHGQFSTKSDVFSFGVLILEIITGLQNSSFCQSDTATDLLSYAWKFWDDGAPLHLMDPTQKGPYSKDEVIKCIHIALLCVQDDPCARPSMATVVAMLDGYFDTLSLPQQPAFPGWSRPGLELDGSTSKPQLEWSTNEVSISELEPR